MHPISYRISPPQDVYIRVSVSIILHEPSQRVQQRSLGGFHETLDCFDGHPTLIENEKPPTEIPIIEPSGSETGEWSLADRDFKEEAFFS